MIGNNTRVLILCTGNSCRSQMAEGFLRHRLNQIGLSSAAAAVRSAGLEIHGLNPLAVKVMAESGVDISGHRSEKLDQYRNDRFDYVITVCGHAAEHCPYFPGPAARIHWPFDDPAQATGTEAEVLSEFRRVRDQIEAKIEEWLKSQRSNATKPAPGA